MADGEARVTRRRDLRTPTGSLPTVTGSTEAVPTTTGSSEAVPTTTGSSEAVPRRHVPREHRRRWIVLTLAAVVVVVALVTGGSWVYARLVAAPAPPPLALETPTAVPSNDPDVPLALAGTWQVSEGSQAGYRIGEVLTGTSLDVVGRTTDVSGSVTLTDDALSAVDVVVQTAAIATDESARDAYFRRALDTSTYPEATFSATGAVDVAALSTATEPISVEVPGALTIRDRTVDVTAVLQVQRMQDGLQAVGSIPVRLTDLGLDAPDLGFVTVNGEGSVEFLLELTR